MAPKLKIVSDGAVCGDDYAESFSGTSQAQLIAELERLLNLRQESGEIASAIAELARISLNASNERKKSNRIRVLVDAVGEQAKLVHEHSRQRQYNAENPYADAKARAMRALQIVGTVVVVVPFAAFVAVQTLVLIEIAISWLATGKGHSATAVDLVA